jgi:anti-anti-sigma factor
MHTEGRQLLVGQRDGRLYVSVCGAATHQTCPTAAKLVRSFLAAHPGGEVIVDLRDADWVDSTFAGWLIGSRKALRREGGTLKLTGAGPNCKASLDNMQLCQLLDFADVDPPAHLHSVRCGAPGGSDRANTRLMLEAHEQLAAVSDDNRRIFGPIAALLRDQLGSA